MKVLKFSATWCGPCKALSGSLKHYTGTTAIEEIDIDENRELVEKYNIRGVPTCILLDDNGIEVSRRSGVMMLDEFEDFIKGE